MHRDGSPASSKLRQENRPCAFMKKISKKYEKYMKKHGLLIALLQKTLILIVYITIIKYFISIDKSLIEQYNEFVLKIQICEKTC